MNSTTEIEGLVASLKGKSGYLPCQFIEMALKEGMIHSEVPIEASQIQPVSLDLRLGQKAYRIQCSFLPENDPVETRLKDVTLYEFDISKGGKGRYTSPGRACGTKLTRSGTISLQTSYVRCE